MNDPTINGRIEKLSLYPERMDAESDEQIVHFEVDDDLFGQLRASGAFPSGTVEGIVLALIGIDGQATSIVRVHPLPGRKDLEILDDAILELQTVAQALRRLTAGL